MHKLLLLIVGVLFTIPGWGREQHAAYVGVWQSLEGTPKTFQVSRDGQTFLLQDLRDYSAQGKLNAPKVLSSEGDQLILKTGFGQAALALRNNGKQLVFDKWTLSKVNDSDAERVKATIASEFAKRIKDRSDCQAIGKLFEERENEINRSSVAASVKLEKQRAHKQEKIAKASEISDCKRQLLIY
jgi:hypothetical protein